MRAWNKYYVGAVLPAAAAGFAGHAAAMGGYLAGPEYASLAQFLDRHFTAGPERYRLYDAFLRRHLAPAAPVLSVASGRCVCEINLLRDGYDISCSDCAEPECLPATRLLWPALRFEKIDMLMMNVERKYAALMALSCLYPFSRPELLQVLGNFRRSVQTGGQLFMDYGGAEDCLLIRLLDEGWLRLGAICGYVWRRCCGQRVVGGHHQHGYRITNRELQELLAATGWRMAEMQMGDIETELRSRSRRFAEWLDGGGWRAQLLLRLGRRMPYVRLFRAIAV